MPSDGLRQHNRVNLAEKVREVPDWPQPGVGFKDVTPLLSDPEALAYTIELVLSLVSYFGNSPL